MRASASTRVSAKLGPRVTMERGWNNCRKPSRLPRCLLNSTGLSHPVRSSLSFFRPFGRSISRLDRLFDTSYSRFTPSSFIARRGLYIASPCCTLGRLDLSCRYCLSLLSLPRSLRNSHTAYVTASRHSSSAAVLLSVSFIISFIDLIRARDLCLPVRRCLERFTYTTGAAPFIRGAANH